MKTPLWQFIDDQGTFRANSPDAVSRLYFPLANEAGILSSITPGLHGDIKTGQNSFLLQPVTTWSLHNSRSSRNFWIHIDGKGSWSLTGASAAQNAARYSAEKDKVTLEAGMIWHQVTRENAALGVKATVANFAPATPDKVEIMWVTITNTGKSTLKITPTAAVPIFGRSADNLRDHRHVTSLLHRFLPHTHGVVVKPTMSFDERGHKINTLSYAVLGSEENGDAPIGAFSSLSDFIGEGGTLDWPEAVVKNLPAPIKGSATRQGRSAIGALRFKTVSLAPNRRWSGVVIMGIAEKSHEIDEWLKKFGSVAKAEAALKQNKIHWAEKINAIRFESGNKTYDGWLRWVSLQPTLRKLFGCSFLPDFDYGRGGRGWRDLWQDCLALLLTAPNEARELLVNNFNGVRIDGSNATIIGTAPGEFIADRNNITRVWMDHGIWPYLTLELYIHQSGDFDVLFQNARYFKDRQLSRARQKDTEWSESDGRNLKTKDGRIVEGSLLEHVLVQHLVQFYNVGEHNHIRLENADWNDGLDMAYERGESVAFSTLYSSNLKKLAALLEEIAKRRGIKKLPLGRELLLLLDRVTGKKVDYGSVAAKNKRLAAYFEAVQPVISGKKTEVPVAKLVDDLRQKSEFIANWVRQKEWIGTRAGDGFYNGYYDNHGRRVEGEFPHGLRMTLAGQTFPIMSGIATPQQVEEMTRTTRKYLKDREHGGFRLNTDFGEIRPDLGRAFSFAYGEKENGAFFSHMVVMYANALYQRNFVKEGREALNSIYNMCLRTEKSKIYPGLPEYFNSDGRGLYHYLTGSASWLVLTALTQVYGIRGFYGDLLLAPKLTQEDFNQGAEVRATAFFAGKRIKVAYRNPKKVGYEHVFVTRVSMNGKELKGLELNKKEVLIPKDLFLKNAKASSENLILVTLE